MRNKIREGTIGLLIVLIMWVISVPMVSAEKVTLKVWEFGGQESYNQLAGEIVEEWNVENPQIRVDSEFLTGGTWEHYNAKVTTALAAGVGPDIFWGEDTYSAQLAHEGFLSSAPDYLVDYLKENMFSKGVFDSLATEGVVRGIPGSVMWLGTFYNKDMYREIGLDPEMPPRTWTELKNYAEKLTLFDSNGDMIRSGISMRFTGHGMGIADKWSPFLFAAGGSFLNEDATKAAVNSDAGIRALQLYVDIIWKLRADDPLVPHDAPAFAQKQTAMISSRGPWVIGYVETNAPEIDFGVCPIPRDDVTMGTGSGGGVVEVWRVNIEAPKEAWQFLYWLAQPEQAKRLLVSRGSLPPYKFLIDDPSYTSPQMQAFLAQENIIGRVLHWKAYEIYSIVGGYIQQVCYRKMKAKEALDAAAIEIDKLLKES